MGQLNGNFTSCAFRVAGPTALAETGITHKDVHHLMIYDAPCSLPGASLAPLPIYGLEDFSFVPRGAAQISGGRFQSPTVSAVCSPPPIRSLCRMRRPETVR